MKQSRSLLALLFVAGLAGSVFSTWLQTKAFASRNSSGTYSLPAGNPVTTDTLISTTWANGTLSDIGTELTNSLDRNGRGAMAAPLQCSSGTVSAPALTFSAEPNSGLYRAASHDIRMSVNGSDVAKWTAAGVNVTGTVTGAAASSAVGVSGTGTAGFAGGTFANGTAATGGTRQDAASLSNGDLDLHSVANATSTTAVTNRLTPSNIPKAWGLLTTDGSHNCTVADGFNLTSCTVAVGGTVTVNFASNFANTNYAVFGTASQSGPKVFYVASAAVGSMTFNVYNSDFSTQTNCYTSACTVSYQVMGKQ